MGDGLAKSTAHPSTPPKVGTWKQDEACCLSLCPRFWCWGRVMFQLCSFLLSGQIMEISNELTLNSTYCRAYTERGPNSGVGIITGCHVLQTVDERRSGARAYLMSAGDLLSCRLLHGEWRLMALSLHDLYCLNYSELKRAHP